MIETRLGKDLSKQLLKVVPNIDRNPHALLRAYCSFLVVREVDFPSIRLDVSNEKLRELLIPELLDGRATDLSLQFLDYSATEFIRFAIPLEVVSCNADTTFDYLSEHFGFESELELMLSILISKQIDYKLIVTSPDSRTKAYDEYKKLTEETGIPKRLDTNSFPLFLYWVYSVNIEDHTQLSIPSGNESERKKKQSSIERIIDILFRNLTINGRSNIGKALQIIHSELRNSKDSESIMNHLVEHGTEYFYPNEKLYEFYNYSEISRTGNSNLEKTILELSRSINTVNKGNLWFNVLCKYYNSRRGRHDIRGGEIKDARFGYERRTDIPLEVSILYSLAAANARYADANILIVLPSPYFIKKWIEDTDLRYSNCKTVFAVEDAFSVDVLEEQFYTPMYAGFDSVCKLQDMIRFMDIHEDEWLKGSYSDIVINEPLLGKDFQQVREYCDGLVRKSDWRRIVSLCADSWMRYHDKSIFPVFEKTTVNNMILFPEGIGGTEPLMKNIWVADKSDSNLEGSCDVYQFSKQTKIKKDSSGNALIDSENRRLFCRTDSLIRIMLEAFKKSGKPIRGFLKDSFEVARPRSRDDFEYKFCNEITFVYHRTPTGKKSDFGEEHYNYKVEFISFEFRTTKKGRREVKPVLLGTQHRPKNYTQDKFLSWIEEEYINQVYSIRTEGRKDKKERESDKYRGKTIREWIADTLGRRYKGAVITLKALWTFYPDLKNEADLTGREMAILRECVFQSVLGNTYLNRIDEESLSDIPMIDYEDENATEVRNMFSKVFSFAMKQGHCRENPFVDLLNSKRDLQKVRSALSKKFFLAEEFRKLYNRILKDVERGDNPVALGILIRMMTAISTAELKALRWSDFASIERYSVPFFVLQVCLRTSLNGKKTKNLPSRENIRIIPLGERLGELLKRYSIGKSPGDLIVSEDRTTPIKNSKIARKLNEYFKVLNLSGKEAHQLSISIPNDRESFSECILTNYGGDILRENYRYWINHVAKFSMDEKNSALGIARLTTLGVFYEDYANEQTILYMYVKQRRLEAFLELGDKKLFSELKTVPERIGEKSNTVNPLLVELQMKPECVGDVELTIANSFGLSVDKFEVATKEAKR